MHILSLSFFVDGGGVKISNFAWLARHLARLCLRGSYMDTLSYAHRVYGHMQYHQ